MQTHILNEKLMNFKMKQILFQKFDKTERDKRT